MRLMKFEKYTKKLKKKDLESLIDIIKQENNESILANLSKSNISKFINQVIISSELNLFVIKKNKIIGYAVVAKKPHFLISNFENLKYYFLIDLVTNLKFITLFNIFLTKVNIDDLFINKKNKILISKSHNLNLLAIEKNHQSKGIGKRFLNYIMKKIKKDAQMITCETNNLRSNLFYKNKLNFRNIGIRIRLPNIMKIMIKKL